MEQNTPKAPAKSTRVRPRGTGDVLRACIRVHDVEAQDADANVTAAAAACLAWDAPEYARIWDLIRQVHREHGQAPSVEALRVALADDDTARNELEQVIGRRAYRRSDLTLALMGLEKQAQDYAWKQAQVLAAAITQGSPGVDVDGALWAGTARSAEFLARETGRIFGAGSPTDPETAKPLRPQEDPNSHLVYVETLDTVWDCRTRTFKSLAAIGRRGGAYETWASKRGNGARRTVDSVVFDPRGTNCPPHMLNVYDPSEVIRPSGNVVPPEAAPELFLRLLRNLTDGDMKNYAYVLQWLAHKVQNPHYNKQCALVLHGAKGSGKGLFGEVLRRVFRGYATMVDQDRLESRFNSSFLFQKLVVIGNEITSDFFKDKRAIANKLKGLVIGDPIMVEGKGKDAVERENFTTWVLLSNGRVPVVLEEGDRRYSVVPSYTTLEEADPSLILPLVRALDDPEWVQGLVDWLHSMDLSGFLPTVPLRNSAKEEMLAESLSATESWWRDCLPPPGDYPLEVLYRHYCRWAPSQGESLVSLAIFRRSVPGAFARPQLRREQFRFRPFYKTIASDKPRCVTVPDRGQDNDYGAWSTGDHDDAGSLAAVLALPRP